MYVKLDVETYRKLKVMDAEIEALVLSNDKDEHGRFRSKALEDLYYHKKALAAQYHNQDLDEIVKTGLGGLYVRATGLDNSEPRRKYTFQVAA